MRLPSSPVRPLLTKMVKAALASAHAGDALRRMVRRDGDDLIIGRRRYRLRTYERLVVVGAGKAAATMARALESILGRRLTDGLVITKYGHGLPTKRIAVAEAGHPLPDRAGLEAARRMTALVRGLTSRDLLVVLLSGGASSLMTAPAAGVTLSAKQRVTDQLLRSGAGIAELNTVRKHLSNDSRLSAAPQSSLSFFRTSSAMISAPSARGRRLRIRPPILTRSAVYGGVSSGLRLLYG